MTNIPATVTAGVSGVLGLGASPATAAGRELATNPTIWQWLERGGHVAGILGLGLAVTLAFWPSWPATLRARLWAWWLLRQLRAKKRNPKNSFLP